VGEFADGTGLDDVGEGAGRDGDGRADVGEGLARGVVRDGVGVGLRLGFGLVVDTDVPFCAGDPAGTGGGRTTR
jgi:hypothetical protein